MGSNMEFQVNNAEQTQALAQKLATYLKATRSYLVRW